MENALQISGLCKSWPGFTLKDVAFSVPRGYIMGLIGPNGAGKTTVIKLIMNLVRRNAGEIKVFGEDNISSEAAVKSRIGFVYDVPPYYDDIALKDIRSAIAPFYPTWNEKSFRELAGEFQLPLKKKFKALSQGMKMKFSLALALSHDAELLILDEPTSGLDPVFRRELLARLSALIQDEKKTVLFSTHITSDLERTADFVTFILDGRIVFSTTRDEIREKWGVVSGGDELLEENRRQIFRGVKRSGLGVRALTDDLERVRRLLGTAVTIERATLDEIMLFVVRGGNHGLL